jgi:putative peptidyl-prolyl cis-trans isomerase
MRKWFTFILLVLSFSVHSGESLNQIMATVGHISITMLDYENGLDKYQKLTKVFPVPKTEQKFSLKTRVMNYLITRAIVDITADEETIQVNESRIESEIKKRMEIMGIETKEQFQKVTQTQTGLPYELWLDEMPFQIKKAQLMQIRVNTQLPTEEEIRIWYNKNKEKVGFELKVREIAIVPKDGSLQEEKRIYDEIAAISSEIRKDKSAFALIANGPRNQSRFRGGLIDWMPAFELYNQNQTITSIAANMRDGMISDIFRDDKKRYCIIKLEGKRPTPLDTIRRGIQNILYREKEESAFDEWIVQRKKEIPITIYDKEYLTENKIDAPLEKFDYSTEEDDEKK